MKSLRPLPWLVLLALMPGCWLPTALRIDREVKLQTEQVEAAAAYVSAPIGAFRKNRERDTSPAVACVTGVRASHEGS
jgi:hypothetical protein